jgi:hypothetical protein
VTSERSARFVVADTFDLDGRCVLVPGFAAAEEPAKRGDCIILRRPDGTFLRTVIAAFEMISVRPPREHLSAPISLPRSVTKTEVPPGTMVTVLGAPAQPSDALLFEVAASFTLEGSGVILTPSISGVGCAATGISLVLVRPDDTTIATTVLPSSTLGARPDQSPLLVALSSRDEAPRGTLVFLAGG